MNGQGLSGSYAERKSAPRGLRVVAFDIGWRKGACWFGYTERVKLEYILHSLFPIEPDAARLFVSAAHSEVADGIDRHVWAAALELDHISNF